MKSTKSKKKQLNLISFIHPKHATILTPRQQQQQQLQETTQSLYGNSGIGIGVSGVRRRAGGGGHIPTATAVTLTTENSMTNTKEHHTASKQIIKRQITSMCIQTKQCLIASLHGYKKK